MARWKQDFDIHPIHSAISNAEELFERALEWGDSRATHELRRIGKVINEIKVILRKVDPETVPIAWLYTLEQAFRHENFETSMRDYIDGEDIDHLITANQTISDLMLVPLHHLKSYYKVTAKESPLRGLETMCDALANRIEELSTNFSGRIIDYENRLKALEDSTAEISAAIGVARDNIDHALSSIESRFTDNENQRSEVFTNNQNTRKDEFARDQRERQKAFAEWFQKLSEEANTKLQDLLSGFSQASGSARDEIKGKLNEILKEARDVLKQINIIYGFTGENTLSGQHLKVAKYEQRVAYVWSLFVFAFIAGTLWWGYHVYVNGNNYITDIPTMTFQLIRTTSITFVLLFGAFFCARQASNHNQSSKRTLWLGLQIHAINPYVHEFEAQKRGDFKDRIGDKLFGVHPEDAARMRKAERVPPNLLKSIIENWTGQTKNQ